MRRVSGAAAAAIACVLAIQIVFVFSLTFVRTHTDLTAIRAHISQAFADGVLGSNERPRNIIHRYGHQFTECVGLHLSIDDEPDPLKATLLPQLHSQYVGPCGELERTAAGIETTDRTDYARYWHGYRLYIWPMLERFSLQNVRFANMLLLFGALGVLAIGLRRAIGDTPAAALIIVLMALTDIWRMWNITTHALSTAIILAGSGLFALAYCRARDIARGIVFAALLGAVFNFYDFLINPPMMPMLLAFIVIATELRGQSLLDRPAVRSALSRAGLVAMSWFGGYALTWATEWILAIWMSPNGQQAGASILAQIAKRVYGFEPVSAVAIYPLIPTLTMIAQSFISVGSVVVAVLAIAIGVFLHANWQAFEWRRFLLLASPTLIAVAWFEILNNHTQTHSHFTYRSESAAVAVVFAAALMATHAPATLRSLLGNLWRTITKRPAQAPAV